MLESKWSSIILLLFLSFASSLNSDIHLLQDLINIYNISEVSIAIPERRDLNESLLYSILKLENTTFNVQSTIKRNFFRHHNQELFIITPKVVPHRKNYMNIIEESVNSRFIVYFSNDSEDILRKRDFVTLFNTIVFNNNSILQYNFINNNFKLLSTFQDILSGDRYIYPDTSWPLITKIRESRDDWFPLFINLQNRFTGIFGYMGYAFKDYINTRIENSQNVSNFTAKRQAILHFEVNYIKRSDGYPVFKTKECFVLPILDEILTNEFLKKPFENWLWIAFFVFILYMSVILRIIHKDSFYCFLESFTISCGSVYKGLSSKNSIKRLIYVQIFIYGFIMWNLYSAKMASYLTTPNRGRTLKTFEDIKDQNIKLWASIPQFSNEFWQNVSYPEYFIFRDRFFKDQFDFKIGLNTLINHLKNFNNSMGYLVRDYTWSFMSRKQILLNRKLFSLSNICITEGYVYPFGTTIDYLRMQEIKEVFYMRVSESGLLYIWQQFTYYDIKFKFLRKHIENVKVLELIFFKIAFIIFCSGISSSIYIFLIEIRSAK